MTDGQSIVKKALEQLRTSIRPEDDRIFADANLRDIWAVAREIENEQAARLTMRNMARIEPFLRTLDSYSGAIDSFCQGFSPMAFVWLGRRHHEILDKLLEALTDIADVLPTVDKMKATFGDDLDFQRTLGLIYSDLLEFLQRVYRFLRRRAYHIYFTFDWGLFDRRFKSIIGTLRSHCELLGRQAAAIHYFEMRKMRDRCKIADEEYERERERKMVQEVFAWLSAAEDSQEDYLHQLSETRQLGTCDWILESDKIYSWIENESGDPFIWLTGIPGAGKSILCSLLIENLQTRKELTTLYYFCGQRRAENDCGTVLRTFILQLLKQKLEMAPLVHQAYYQKAPSRSKRSLMTILRELLSNLKTTRIILDGIDEWDLSLQEELLRSLVELQRHSGNSCKLLVSSRQEPQISKAMPKKTEFPLEGNTAGGLQEYIHERVKELKYTFPGLEPELVHRVELRLRQMAKGMFLWVHLVTSMLQQQVSELDFEEAIEKLPDGLEQAYGRILSRIEDLKPDLKDRAFRILFWLCTTFRPIKVHEVADGLALRPGRTVLNRKTRFQDTKRDIVDFLAPMVERVDNGVLSLVHFSAKQYLLDPQSGPFLALAQAHFDIAFSCVANLTSALNVVPRFSSPNGGMTEADVEASIVQGSYGLQEYGHQFWAEHVREYARLVQSPDDQTKILAGALNAFGVVQKGPCGDKMPPGTVLQLYTSAEQLPGLVKFPALQTFVNKWLSFRSDLDKTGVDFENLNAQDQWQLQKDYTYLTQVNQRLREATERLLALDPSNLPRHIQAADYTAFIDRFAFNYKIESSKTYASETHENLPKESEHALSNTATPIITLNEIREKVAQNGYDTLLDFKNDLQSIPSNQIAEATSENRENVNKVVDHEIGLVMSGFPDFANLPSKPPGSSEPEGGQDMDMSHNLEGVNGATEVMSPPEGPNGYVPSTRVPYWSAAERRELPKLLEQFGNNFPRISSSLKTKTSEEVEHQLQLQGLGGDHLASRLEAADAKLDSPWSTDESDLMIEDNILGTVLPEDSSQENSSPGAQGSMQAYDNAVPGRIQPEAFGATQHPHSHKDRSTLKNKAPASGIRNINGAPTRKKPLRPKEYCTNCAGHPVFSTYSALMMHHKRLHLSTRKYWVCNDVSTDKSFFADCTACSKLKRYKSKHIAYNHLRRFHFPSKPPIGTLERWMKEMEESNPAYKVSGSSTEVAHDPDPSSGRNISRMPKLSGGVQLKRLADVLKELDLQQLSPSPPAEPRNDGQSNLSTEDGDHELNADNAAKSRRDVLLQDVTFDQVLGASTTQFTHQSSSSAGSSQSDPTSDPRRALIRSDHVAKLTYLSEYQRVICQNQVDVLNHVLDTTSVMSRAYKDAFKRLETLSCTILENLRDQRRQRARAPNIPFSV